MKAGDVVRLPGHTPQTVERTAVCVCGAPIVKLLGIWWHIEFLTDGRRPEPFHAAQPEVVRE